MTSDPVPHVVLAALADEASVEADGLVNLRRAAPEWWGVDAIPSRTTIPFVLVVGVEQPSVGLPVRVTLRFVGPDGVLLDLPLQIPTSERNLDEFVEGALAHRPLIVKVDLTVERVGPHRIEVLSIDGDVLATVRFVLRLKPTRA